MIQMVCRRTRLNVKTTGKSLGKTKIGLPTHIKINSYKLTTMEKIKII